MAVHELPTIDLPEDESIPARLSPLQRLRADIVLVLAVLGVGVMLVIMFFPALFSHSDPTALDPASSLLAPSPSHPFGTDEVGRDLLSRVIFGARNSLGVAFAVVIPATAFGVLVGALAGWIGGVVDQIMMRIVDIVLAFPIFVLAMAIAGARGRSLETVVISLVLIWWPSYARLVRGKFLSLRTRPYVDAARAFGVSLPAMFRRHLLPFVMDELNVRVTTDVGYALVAVTSLSFLGIGAQSPTPEWGLLISDSRTYAIQAWWYFLFPGLAIVVATLVFTFLGESMAARRQGRG